VLVPLISRKLIINWRNSTILTRLEARLRRNSRKFLLLMEFLAMMLRNGIMMKKGNMVLLNTSIKILNKPGSSLIRISMVKVDGSSNNRANSNLTIIEIIRVTNTTDRLTTQAKAERTSIGKPEMRLMNFSKMQVA